MADHISNSPNPSNPTLLVERLYGSPPVSETASGSQVSHATSHTAGSALNPRSCIKCRARKVKCDKKYPCVNCKRADTECQFPAPGRAPRRPRRPPDGELLARLRKLEGIVKSLGIDGDGNRQSPDVITTTSSQSGAAREKSMIATPDYSTSTANAQQLGFQSPKDSSLHSNFGRLVLDEGKSRYVYNSFWANMSNEVEDLKSMLRQSSDESSDESFSPTMSDSGGHDHTGFIFGTSGSSPASIHSLHPSPEIIDRHWKIYEDHVDPLTKILHLPTMREHMKNLRDSPSDCSRGMEALLFTIYYASVTSLSAEECLKATKEPRELLLSRYRMGVEKALARAKFLVTEELIVLQALTLFMICLRRHEDPRHVYSLTGIVYRIAITMGLHRDPSNFGLPPFESEMRRRLWWLVTILDTRLSEDHGCDPTILPNTFDTKFPLNLHDADFTSDRKAPYEEATGVTEMTFCLIRYEVGNTFRKLHYAPPNIDIGGEHYGEATLQEKERWIEECHERLELRYLKYCTMKEPMHWVICTVSRLIMAKMWLTIYQPYQRLDGGASLPQATRDRLFVTSLESIEYSMLLETELRTVKWAWLFKTYAQWHSLAFLLSELCTRTRGSTVCRAWRAVDSMLSEWGSVIGKNKRSHLWRPLRKLFATAKAAYRRGQETNLLNPRPTTEGGLSEPSPASYGDLPKQAKAMHGSRSPEVAAAGVFDFGNDLSMLANDSMRNLDLFGATLMDNYDSRLNDAFAPSPFFVNQPQISGAQWDDFPVDLHSSNFMTDVLVDGSMGSTELLPNNNLYPSFDASNLLNSSWSDSANPTSNFAAEPCQAPDLREQGKYFDSHPMQITTTNVAIEAEKQYVGWDDWDDMVRGFHIEAGKSYPGVESAQPQGTNLSAGRPPMMGGENWF